MSSFGTIALTALVLPLQLTGLGTEAFGAWALLQTLSAFRGWGAILDLGAGPAAVRLVAERSAVGDDSGAASAAIGALTISAIGGLAGGAAIIFGASLDPGRAFGLDTALSATFANALVFYAMALPFELVTRAAQMSMEGLQHVSVSRGLEFARRAIVLVTTSFVALWTGNVASTAMSFAIVAPAISVGTLLILRRQLGRTSFRWESLRTLLIYGRALLALKPLGITHRMMDRLLVGALLGPAAVAVVEIVTVVQNGAQAVPSASAHAVMPSTAWLEARADRTTQRTLILTASLGSLFATLPIVIIPALISRDLLQAWLGESVPSSAAAVLPIALLYSVVAATGHVSSEFLAGSGRASTVARWSLAAVLVNLLLSIVLILQFGVVGAFVSTLVTAPLASGPIVLGALSVVGSDARQFVRESILPVIGPALALGVVVTGTRWLLSPSTYLVIVVASGAGLATYIGVASQTIPWKPIVAGLRAQSPSAEAD